MAGRQAPRPERAERQRAASGAAGLGWSLKGSTIRVLGSLSSLGVRPRSPPQCSTARNVSAPSSKTGLQVTMSSAEATLDMSFLSGGRSRVLSPGVWFLGGDRLPAASPA